MTVAGFDVKVDESSLSFSFSYSFLRIKKLASLPTTQRDEIIPGNICARIWRIERGLHLRRRRD